MVQGFFGNIGNVLGGVGSKLGGVLSTAGNNFKTSFANAGNNMSTVGNRINNALYGTPTYDYGSRNQAYLDKLRERQDFQDLAKSQNMSVDEALKGVMQGLNYGSEKIADEQTALGIRKPNANQVDLAREGLFNQYGMRREGGFVNDHPVLSGIGNALLGGGMEYLGQKLNEPYRHNLITASYYGNRYTPYLEKPDEQWGQKMTQGIQGLMMGNPVDPNKEKEEQPQQQQQQPQQQGGGDDDDEEKAAKARAAFYSINSNNYSPVDFNPLNSYTGRYA